MIREKHWLNTAVVRLAEDHSRQLMNDREKDQDQIAYCDFDQEEVSEICGYSHFLG